MTNDIAKETTFSKIKPYFDTIKKDVNFEQIADKLIASSLLLPEEFNHINSLPLNSERVSYYLETILPKRDSTTFLEVLRQANYAWISDEILPAKQLPFPLNGRKEKMRTSASTGPVIKRAKSVVSEDCVDASVVEAPMDEDVCGNCDIGNAVPAISPLTSANNNNTTSPNKVDKCSDSTFQCIIWPSLLYNNLKLISELTKEIITMASKSNYLLGKWLSLCHHLELDSEATVIRMHLATNPQDSNMPIIHLLKAWKEQYPKQATVGNLVKNLRELKANELAGKLYLYNKKILH